MKTAMKLAAAGAVIAAGAALIVPQAVAQAPDSTAPARGGRGGGGRGGSAAQTWWVNKTAGGVYKSPMRPLWTLAALKALHPGQNTWQEQIILDPECDATYNSGAPGTKYPSRLHPDTPAVYIVIAGQVHFEVEGQQPITATRGAVVNIMKGTIYSYEVQGDQNALWVEDRPTNYKTVYPSSDPPPAPTKDGKIIKISFNHTPAPYTGTNVLMFNTIEDIIGKCGKGGVLDDHIFVSPLLGFVNPEDNKCGGGSGNIGSGPAKPTDPPFDPKSTFGHMHPGPAEWWIVQIGKISGKFENQGEFHAVEGDVLYAAPMMWHQMAAEAPSGPNVRLAMGGYQLINMNNTESAGGRGQ